MRAVRRILSFSLVLAGVILVAGDGMQRCEVTAAACQTNYVRSLSFPELSGPLAPGMDLLQKDRPSPDGRRSWCPLRRPEEPGRSYSNRQAAYDMARGLKI